MIITTETTLQNTGPTFSKSLRAVAVFISYVFHPLFIPLYIAYYIAFINTGFFAGQPVLIKYYVLIWVFVNMFFFPALSVLLLKAVGFIDTVYLRTKKDRIIPYIAANLFYFWMFLVFHNHLQIPLIVTSFVLGVFITSSLALIANIYFKISMHAMGMGGAIGVMLVILFYTPYSTGISLPLMVVLILSGMVCSSRLICSDHTPKEIYSGLILGILFQIIAAKIIL